MKNFVLIGNGVMGMRHCERLLAVGCSCVATADTAEEANEVFESLRTGAVLADFSVIAAPATLHFEYAKKCLELGLHTFVEKPIALNFEDANALIALAKKKQLILFPGHSERYSETFESFAKTTKPLLKNGNVHLTFIRHNLPSERCRDVPCTLDILVHDLDMFFALCGVDFEAEVLAATCDFDQARLTLRLNNVTADFDVCRNAKEPCRSILFENECAKFTADFCNAKQVQDTLSREQNIFLNSDSKKLAAEQSSAALAVKIASSLNA